MTTLIDLDIAQFDHTLVRAFPARAEARSAGANLFARSPKIVAAIAVFPEAGHRMDGSLYDAPTH